MALSNHVVASTDETRVRIVYLDRDTAKRWNARRKPGDVAIFCGWYWIKGPTEYGPFRSKSSAYRDAYYQLVLQREPPSLSGAWRHNKPQAKPATPARKAEART